RLARGGGRRRRGRAVLQDRLGEARPLRLGRRRLAAGRGRVARGLGRGPRRLRRGVRVERLGGLLRTFCRDRPGRLGGFGPARRAGGRGGALLLGRRTRGLGVLALGRRFGGVLHRGDLR